MTKKDENDIEQKLLNSTSFDELIKKKIETELKNEIEKAKIKTQTQTITDISKVPSELIFSKKSTYRIFNKVNKTESFINGLQAESMLGLQNNVREKIKNGKVDVFSTEELYIKFEKTEY